MTIAEFDALYTLRHEKDAFEKCVRFLETPDGDYEWLWRAARLRHFVAMQCEDAGNLPDAKNYFALALQSAKDAFKFDGSRVEGLFWLGTCELESARLGGKLALAAKLSGAQKALEHASRIDEGFHFAGPLRVLGRITHQKPLILGGSLDNALAFYNRALQIAPHNSTTLLYCADALLADRQPARARQTLKQILSDCDTQNWAWETARDQKIAGKWLENRLD